MGVDGKVYVYFTTIKKKYTVKMFKDKYRNIS